MSEAETVEVGAVRESLKSTRGRIFEPTRICTCGECWRAPGDSCKGGLSAPIQLWASRKREAKGE